MNLRKIIKEEMDEFDWIKEVNPGINLEPNTMYFFIPKADVKTVHKFADGITNAPKIKKRLENRRDGLSYFVTSDDVNELSGWCNGTDPLQGREEFYNNEPHMLDVRKTFGDIL